MLLLLVGCFAAESASNAAAASPGWLKGQLHAHSDVSGDSDTPRAVAAAWYARHGYDFLVFTDHNAFGPLPSVGDPPMLVLPGVELTQNLRACEPPPEPGLACLLHVNALFSTGDSVPDLPLASRREDIFRVALAAADNLGALAQLNHPDFHYAADADLIARLATGRTLLLEVANEAIDSNNGGDATHLSTEAIWDAVLARGVRVWGTATDDAHHYDDAEATRARGELAFTGDRGFVMVRAARDPAAIRSALERGAFYASNGAVLTDVTAEGGVLKVRAADPEARIEVITAGRVVAQARGEVVCPKPTPPLVTRVRVTDSRGRKAWTQPVFGEGS